MSQPARQEPHQQPGHASGDPATTRPQLARAHVSDLQQVIERKRAARVARLLHLWLTVVTAGTTVLYYGPDADAEPALLLATSLLAAGIFAYAQTRERRSRSIARLSSLGQSLYRLRAIIVGGLLLAATAWLVPGLPLTPGTVATMAAALVVMGAVWSWLTRVFLGARHLDRVLVVGYSAAAAEMLDAFRNDPHPEYEILGVAATASDLAEDDLRSPQSLGYEVLGEPGDIDDLIREHAVDVVVVAVRRGRLDLFARLSELGDDAVVVQELSAFSEDAFGKVPVEVLNAAWFMYMIHPFYRPYSRVAKRAADIVMATVIGLAVAPVLPLVALAVRLTSPGPALYRQVRVGEQGREFSVYKFRSMRVDAEKNGAQFAARNDPRVTPVGRFIRSTRLDELPQLWNILRGHMSFVGPRPERPTFVADLEQQIPYYRRRHMVKPGLTGWAQVRWEYTDSTDGSANKLGFDLYYLKHQSLLFDLAIFLETVRVVAFRFGSR